MTDFTAELAALTSPGFDPAYTGPTASFAEPWSVQVFALTVALREAALRTGNATLHEVVTAVTGASGGDDLDVIGQWLDHLEDSLLHQAVLSTDQLADAYRSVAAAGADDHGIAS